MTGDETEVALRLLTGHWPRPALTEAETAVWVRTLSARRLDLSVTVIDRIAATGATWRPTDGEFVAAYRQAVSRLPRVPVDRTAPELDVTTERKSPAEWLAEARSHLMRGATHGS